jgi:hypothetical protein
MERELVRRGGQAPDAKVQRTSMNIIELVGLPAKEYDDDVQIALRFSVN